MPGGCHVPLDCVGGLAVVSGPGARDSLPMRKSMLPMIDLLWLPVDAEGLWFGPEALPASARFGVSDSDDGLILKFTPDADFVVFVWLSGFAVVRPLVCLRRRELPAIPRATRIPRTVRVPPQPPPCDDEGCAGDREGSASGALGVTGAMAMEAGGLGGFPSSGATWVAGWNFWLAGASVG